MRPCDGYEAFSSSLQSMFAECAAVTKLCGHVAKLLADSTTISLESSPRGIIGHGPSFLGSYETLSITVKGPLLVRRSRSAISEPGRTAETTLLSPVARHKLSYHYLWRTKFRGFDLYMPYNEPAARTEHLPFWSNSLRYKTPWTNVSF